MSSYPSLVAVSQILLQIFIILVVQAINLELDTSKIW